ncbi:MAG: LURP-one-related family protein [Finegoldia sp.]|nr:LURP-one-related family protein [Finegoldia sp.]
MKKLYFKEEFFKLTDNYPIMDEDGQDEFFLHQNFTLMGYRANVNDKDDNLAFTIERKVFNLFPTYRVNFTDGKKMIIKAKLSLINRKVMINYNGDILKLKGNILDHEFGVYNSSGKIAEIDKKLFSFTDHYELTIFDENYTQALIAICICLNNMKDIEDSNSED